MPGPFPGMDPYLETPERWRDVHQTLIVILRAELSRLLPAPFVARIEQRLYVAPAVDPLRPDVSVVRLATARANPLPATGRGGVATAVAERAAVRPAVVLHGAREEVREAYIHITPARDPNRVITAIEVLNPTNKRTAEGRRQYQTKQVRVLAEGVTHLLEIDLLRSGQHLVAANEEMLRGAGEQWDYIISLARAGTTDYEAWPCLLQERLPAVWVPLADGYDDIPLDIQAALDRAYDDANFGREIDYTSEPDPPLTPEDAGWADTLLRQKGVRS